MLKDIKPNTNSKYQHKILPYLKEINYCPTRISSNYIYLFEISCCLLVLITMISFIVFSQIKKSRSMSLLGLNIVFVGIHILKFFANYKKCYFNENSYSKIAFGINIAYCLANTIVVVTTNEDSIIIKNLYLCMIINSFSVVVYHNSIKVFNISICSINTIANLINFFITQFSNKFNTNDYSNKLFLEFFLLIFLSITSIYFSIIIENINEIFLDNFESINECHKQNIKHIEELIQNMSVKFVCFNQNTPYYCNKSYIESIEKFHAIEDKCKEDDSKPKNRKKDHLSIFNLENYVEEKDLDGNKNINNFYNTESENLVNEKKTTTERQELILAQESSSNPKKSYVNTQIAFKNNSFTYKNLHFLNSLIKYNTSGTSQNISLGEMLQDIMNYNIEDESKEFIKLGIFYNITSNNNGFKSFFEVFYRKFAFEDLPIVEIMMSEVTEVKESEKVFAENKYKQKIFSKLAHEFKTPLNNINSVTNTLCELNSEIKENLSTIMTYVNQFNTIINSSFLFNKNQNNNLNLNDSTSNINNFTLSKQDLNDKSPKINDNSSFSVHSISSINNIIINLQKLQKNNIQVEKMGKIIIALANFTVFQVEDIIDYSQNFDYGISKLDMIPVKLSESLEYCFEILESLLYVYQDRYERVIPKIIIDPKIKDLKIKTNETKLKQVILNLLTNSVKFTSSGSITLSCEYQDNEYFINNKIDFQGPIDSGAILLKISDTGTGIEDAKKRQILKKIEEKFSNQIDDTDYMASSGTGLGFYIVKAICQRLRYNFLIESEKGKGSTFTIIISQKFHSDDTNVNSKYSDLEQMILSLNRENLDIKPLMSPNFNTMKSAASKIWKKTFVQENTKSNFISPKASKNNFNININLINNENRKVYNLGKIFNLDSKKNRNSKKEDNPKLTKVKLKNTKSNRRDSKRYQALDSLGKRLNKNLNFATYDLERNSIGYGTNRIKKAFERKFSHKDFTVSSEIFPIFKDKFFLYPIKVISNRIKKPILYESNTLNKEFSKKFSINKLNYQITLENEKLKVKKDDVLKKINTLNSKFYDDINYRSNYIEDELNNDKYEEDQENYDVFNSTSEVFSDSEKNKSCETVKKSSKNLYLENDISDKQNGIISNKISSIKKTSSFNFETGGIDTNFINRSKLRRSSNKIASFQFNYASRLKSSNTKNTQYSNSIKSNKKPKLFENDKKLPHSKQQIFFSPNDKLKSFNNYDKNNSSNANSLLDETLEEKNIELKTFLALRSEFILGNEIKEKEKMFKILVVDDSPQILKATCSLINKVVSKNSLKYEVLSARDGIDILKLIMDDQSENLIKIVFTDEHMQMMNGSESVKFIRRLEREGKLKGVKQFVSVTCFSDEVTKSNIQSAGIEYVINKPVSVNKMEEILSNLVKAIDNQ